MVSANGKIPAGSISLNPVATYNNESRLNI